MNEDTNSYFESSDWSEPQQEQSIQQVEQPQQQIPQFDPNQYVPRDQFEQLQSGLKQALGLQPEDNKQKEIDSYLNQWAKSNGLMTQQDFQQAQEVSRAEGVAREHGFASFDTAYNYYNYAVQTALATGQKAAEANQIINLANQNRWSEAMNLSVKYFGKPNMGTPNINLETNQMLGNTQPQDQNYFNSPQYRADLYSSDAVKRERAFNARRDALAREMNMT